MGRIASFVYKRSRLIIILVAILNIAALASLFRFQLDTDFLSFFSEGNPRAEEYDLLNEKYQIGEAISVLIEQDGSLLSEENLKKVFRIQEEIEEIDGVFQVQSFIPPEFASSPIKRQISVPSVSDKQYTNSSLLPKYTFPSYVVASEATLSPVLKRQSRLPVPSLLLPVVNDHSGPSKSSP